MHCSTSQLPQRSGAEVFWHFGFEMRFASHLRALFQHPHFRSENAAPRTLGALRHNHVHLCNISTSKSALNIRCFWHFDFQMCRAPQRCRAIF
jgi:hypothetical protein